MVKCDLSTELLQHFSKYAINRRLHRTIESSVDILKVILILLQVPKGAKIVNNGIHTYFRAEPLELNPKLKIASQKLDYE
jgi:hypothetical protein